MRDEWLLAVRGLSVVFYTSGGEVQAVDRLSVDVLAGECHALVGESGSGKSVTALSVMRLLSRSTARITGGQIFFRHPQRGVLDILTLSDKEMRGIRGRYMGMVFQEPMTSLNPVQRCGPQIMEVLLWHGGLGRAQARLRTLELLSEVQLPGPERIFRAWPHELSGGQKQRVMIAMAMACNPVLLIADEPSTALDVTVQRGILSLIRRLQQRHGMAVLFISHDLGVVHAVADSLSVMRSGRVLEQGLLSAVLGSPQHPYTKALLACRPPLGSRPARLSVVEDLLNMPAGGDLADTEKEAPSGFRPMDPDAPQGEENIGQAPSASSHARPLWHKGHGDEVLLEVRALNTHFVNKRDLLGRPRELHKAVDGISFSVYKGETLGLVGESGCGKTTLGRSIMQLLRIRSGQVLYKGVDLSSLSARQLRRLRPKFQIIFQDPYASLSPGMAIGEAIMEPMRLHGIMGKKKERKERIMSLLERVGLESRHYDRYPHEFSGGQRQRVCIARALALDPEFIVCDESVSALDVSVQAQVLNLLNELKTGFGLTYVFISHDLSVVKYMSDRILVMRDGRMVEMEDADRLYTHPRDAYTRRLIEAIPSF